MDDAKLRFSPEEIRLVTDAGWILTKNSVIEKVVRMMAGLSGDYREIWAARWGLEGYGRGVSGGGTGSGAGSAVGWDPGSPKISRGENYRGLPWVMLDFPRIFGQQDVLAIRTMFWWGHGFIITLHLKGSYRRQSLPVLQRDWAALADAGFHVGISEDEWRHEHVRETYRPITGEKDLMTELGFLKLSATLTLDRWEEGTEMLRGCFTLLVNTLASCYPGDEKGPSPGSSRAGSDL